MRCHDLRCHEHDLTTLLERAAAISGLQSTWDYTEAYIGQDDILTAAGRPRDGDRGRRGTPDHAGRRCSPSVPRGPPLDARSVVEIGTGCGVSGVWLLRGMNPEGVLTSIDLEAENQRLAKQAYADAGFATATVRG